MAEMLLEAEYGSDDDDADVDASGAAAAVAIAAVAVGVGRAAVVIAAVAGGVVIAAVAVIVKGTPSRDPLRSRGALLRRGGENRRLPSIRYADVCSDEANVS